MKINPPQRSLQFLRWFCREDYLEEIEGDLTEVFIKEVETSPRKAKWKFTWSVIKYFRPQFMKSFKNSSQLNSSYMFSHYFKIFVRTAWRSKGYSLINVGGLAIGIACSIFTLLWTMDEFAFDDFHKDKERIFAFRTNSTNTGGIFTFDATSGRLAEGLMEFPEVEQSARASFRQRILFNYKDKSFYEQGVYADASLLTIFTFPLIEGDVTNPLPDANSAVITRKLAKKYFKGENAIGKIIRINNETDVRITAVAEDIPEQSTIQFQLLLPYSIYKKTDPYNEEWGAWTGGNTYVKLRAGTDKTKIEEKISKQITHPRIWPRWGETVEHVLLPLTDWHLRSNYENGRQSGGRIEYVKVFGLVASFILLIACVNFMNLATARSLNRAKEIGVRKVVGAVRQSLAGQFLSESVLISVVSLIAALGLIHLLLPLFNELTDKKIFIDYTSPLLISGFVGITLFTGLIAGSYPAFFLSSLRAIQILKDKFSGGGGANVRKTLVVFQFSLSVILIICSLVVYRQIEYMREKDLGFDRHNVFYIRASDHLNKNFASFKQQLVNYPGILSITRAANEPMNIQNGLELADDGWRGKRKEDNVAFQWLKCDHDFLSAFKFDFVAGRNFSTEFPADSNNFIINEEAARQMRFDSPVGEALKVIRKGTIIGVVKNFHSAGLDQPIQPVVISMNPEESNQFFIHYKPGKLTEAMDYVTSVYKKVEPDFPMEYTFLDDTFSMQYKNEILTGKLSTCFMIIAVFISCLGLLGLSTFTAERRVKEIGIRKILGANVSQLITLLCRDFVILIVLALVIGVPIAWWLGNQFLATYAFRTDLNLSTFIVTSVSVLVIALLTVSYQSAKAALRNPVKSLRTE